MSQSLSNSLESSLHSYSCALSRIMFVLSDRFRVQTVATAMNARGVVQRTPPRAHTRALFLAAHARLPDVITHLASGSRLDDLFVCL